MDSIRHVYVSPKNSITCLILAFAWYLFSNPGIITPVPIHDNDKYDPNVKRSLIDPSIREPHISQKRYTKLFPGCNQYDLFMKYFRKATFQNEDELWRFGIWDGNHGVHSARKGPCSYAFSGSTIPPIVSVCLHAQWSRGSIKEQYLHYEKVGDQYLGQVVSDLNHSRYLFALSLPYFDFDCADCKALTVKELNGMIASFILQGSYLNFHIFCIFWFCFAPL